MTGEVFATADKLSKVIRHTLTCLQCTICLQTISKPAKTTCGHRFCNACIRRVVQNKNAQCPLCKSPIQRRSIIVDEDMNTYISLVEELIESVKKDSGIDISSNVGKHKDESYPNIDSKPEMKDHAKPSCSKYDLSILKDKPKPRSYSNKHKKTFGASKEKRNVNSGVDKNLSKCSMSGVEPLPSTTPHSYRENIEGIKYNDNVYSWLNALPENEALDDPDKIVDQPVECDLDDTVVVSVSQNFKDDNQDDHRETEEEQQRWAALRRSAEADKNEINTKNGLRTNEARDPDASASGIATPSKENVEGCSKTVETKDKNQDKCSDVQRTSPCDLLPTTKNKWSSVVKFGKEMKTRKKKLKSLNVSRSRAHEDDGEESFKTEGRKKGTGTTNRVRKKEKSKGSETINVIRGVLNQRSFENKETDIWERKRSTESTKREEEIKRPRPDPSPSNTVDTSENNRSKEEQASFVTLEDGEQVQIRKLNNLQMQDIIGVVDEDQLTEPMNEDDHIRMDNTLPPKKRHNNRPNAPSYAYRSLPVEATPTKLPTNSTGRVNKINEWPDSSPREPGYRTNPTPNHRLSLSRRGTDPKSNDSSCSTRDSRLLAARRDLNLQMADDSVVPDNGKDKQDPKENDKSANSEFVASSTGSNKLVLFKKLGKVYKRRKNRVPFFYMHSIQHEPAENSSLLIKGRPCNLVDYLDTQFPSTSRETFGNDMLITVNDSEVLTDQTDNLNKPDDTRSETVTQNTNDPPVAEGKSNSIVVLLSLDAQENSPFVKETVQSTQKTSSRNTVKLLSPTKDSQLKFFSAKSPTTDPVPTLKPVRPIEPVTSNESKKDSLSEIRGTHSRALIRRSQQDSNASDLDLPSRKRKRSKIRDESMKEEQRKARRMYEEKDYDSNHSFSSEGTRIKSSVPRSPGKENKESSLPIIEIKDDDVSSVSSDTNAADQDRDDFEKPKRVCGRIIPLINSDTDSPEIARISDAIELKGPIVSPSSKRKRSSSESSDVELKSIVSEWCEGLNSSDRCKKRDKLEEATVNLSREKGIRAFEESQSSRFSRFNKDPASQRRHLPEFGSKLSEKEDGVVHMDEDSPVFAATIDKIQNIRNKTMAANVANVKQKPEVVQDTFEELNFDSNAFDDYFEEKTTSKVATDGSQRVKSVASSKVCSNNSDKENNYKCKRVACNSDNESDNTLTSDRVNSTNKPKPLESMSEQPKKNDTVSCDKEKVNDKPQENVNCSKAVDYGHDSLLDITQHYMHLKQFEIDLFGGSINPKANSFEPKNQGQKTPSKTPRKTTSKDKDTEHSADEDDIVENTPDTKTKNLVSIIPSLRANVSPPESSLASPIAKIDENIIPRTPTSTRRGSLANRTPLFRRSIRPLFESTPKSNQSLKMNNSKLSIKATINEATIKQTKSSTPTPKRRLCFVCSGLMPFEIEQVLKLAEMMNARYVTQFDEQVTHVIVKTNRENNGTVQTLKFLQGVSHRKWIVGYPWVVDSLMEKKLVNEELYEAVDCKTLEAGPRNSRLRNKGLFEGFTFCCIGPYDHVSEEQYEDLLRANGATVVDSLETLAIEKRKLKIIVIQSDVDYQNIVEWYQKTKAVPVVHDWIVECISQYKLVSFFHYLQELSRQDVLALGYPDYLVEEVELDGYFNNTSSG